MFSTVQLDMSQSLIATYYEQGYCYYLCHTNTNLDNYSYNNYDFADLTFYFSKEPIMLQNNNNFVCNGDYVKVNAITRNVSNNDNDNKLNRLNYINGNNLNISVPLYEHILTNADNSYFMNTLAELEYNNVHNLDYNIGVEEFLVPSVLLGVIVVSMWLKSWFAKNYKKE